MLSTWGKNGKKKTAVRVCWFFRAEIKVQNGRKFPQNGRKFPQSERKSKKRYIQILPI